jgi:hypothetical protein
MTTEFSDQEARTREDHEMTKDRDVCWGVHSPLCVFGPFESEEEACAYIYSKRFDFDPCCCSVFKFEWTRPNMPQFRDPDTGRPKSSNLNKP